MGSDFATESQANDNPFAPGRSMPNQQEQPYVGFLSNDGSEAPEPGKDGARYYTIQRVNGNGANGKGDGTAGAHKHTIEESDRVKKSSIHRHFLKEEKEKKKSLVSQEQAFNTLDFPSSRLQAFQAATSFFSCRPRSATPHRRHREIKLYALRCNE